VVELSLILAINLGGLSFAIALARWLSARDAGTPQVQRLGAAVARATRLFLWRECRSIALAVAGSAALLLAAHAFSIRAPSPFGSVESALWATLALCLGAASAWAAAYAGGRLGSIGSVRLLSAAQHSTNRALMVALRASGAASLAAETLSMLGVCTLFALLYTSQGGFGLPAAEAYPLTLRVAALLPAYALGAAAAALVVQRGGSNFHVAGDVGAVLATSRDGAPTSGQQNPAAITELVGDHVGIAAARSCDLFLSASVANIAAVIIGASIQEANRGALPSTLSLVLLPAMVRSFGLVASGVGLMVVRVRDDEDPSRAVGRGHIAAWLVALGGLLGTCLWLAGQAHWERVFLAGLCGSVAALAISCSVQYWTHRRHQPLASAQPSTGADALLVAQGLAAGLQAALLPVLGLGAAMAAAWHFGASTGLRGGGLFGSIAALSAMLSTAPFVLAAGNFGAMADNARGVAGMSNSATVSAGPGGSRNPDAARKLDAAGVLAAASARTYLVLVGCLAAVLAAAAVPLLDGWSLEGARVDFGKPPVIWSGALGAAFVLAYAGNAVASASRGARSIALEVERQLASFTRHPGLSTIPEDFVPSYRACIELVSRISLNRVLVPVAGALLLPALLGIALRLMYRSFDPGLWAEGLMSFVVVAAVTGLGAALAVDAARATLGAARRAGRPRSNTDFGASVPRAAAFDLIGNSAGPAAYLVVKAAAVSSLIVASFLT
jgi:K(+)-stimulated pyrophosphate-energized sodium pump